MLTSKNTPTENQLPKEVIELLQTNEGVISVLDAALQKVIAKNPKFQGNYEKIMLATRNALGQTNIKEEEVSAKNTIDKQVEESSDKLLTAIADTENNALLPEVTNTPAVHVDKKEKSKTVLKQLADTKSNEFTQKYLNGRDNCSITLELYSDPGEDFFDKVDQALSKVDFSELIEGNITIIPNHKGSPDFGIGYKSASLVVRGKIDQDNEKSADEIAIDISGNIGLLNNKEALCKQANEYSAQLSIFNAGYYLHGVLECGSLDELKEYHDNAIVILNRLEELGLLNDNIRISLFTNDVINHKKYKKYKAKPGNFGEIQLQLVAEKPTEADLEEIVLALR